MNDRPLYSVRMRAKAGARHLSGAECLVTKERVAGALQRFLARAWSKGVRPDEVVLTVEPVSVSEVLEVRALDLSDMPAQDVAACREAAGAVLRSAGVSREAIQQAFSLLQRGPAPDGGPMRGAMVIDAATGARLEPDQKRGIRASRFDWSDAAFLCISEELARLGLSHFRTREALALATKIAHAPSFVAELCWSDDPDYLAGYASSRTAGYTRFPAMKEARDLSGGRAIFVDRSCDLNALMSYLEEQPVIISSKGQCLSRQECAARAAGRAI